MGLNLNRISLGAFQKPKIRDIITIDGKVYAVMEPDQVHGKIDVPAACEPKTDFDKYYKHNLGYFNLFSSAVYEEYLQMCENEIKNQKLQSKASCVGREGLANMMFLSCMAPAVIWGLVSFVKLIASEWGK